MTTELPAMPTTRTSLLDPPAEYHQLREEQPVTRVRFPNGQAGWLVTRFEEGSAVFADPRMSARRPRHDVRPTTPAPRTPTTATRASTRRSS